MEILDLCIFQICRRANGSGKIGETGQDHKRVVKILGLRRNATLHLTRRYVQAWNRERSTRDAVMKRFQSEAAVAVAAARGALNIKLIVHASKGRERARVRERESSIFRRISCT